MRRVGGGGNRLDNNGMREKGGSKTESKTDRQTDRQIEGGSVKE